MQRAFDGKELLSTSLSFDHWPLISALGKWLINYFLSCSLDPLTSPTSTVSHQCPKCGQHRGCATASPYPWGCHEHEQMGLVMADPCWGDSALGCLLGACEGWFFWLLEENSGLALFPSSGARRALSTSTANSSVTAPAIPLIPFRNVPNPASWEMPALPGTSCSCPVLALTLPQGN